MKFKVVKGPYNALYNQLIQLRGQMKAANKQALTYANTLGFESIRIKSMALAGGISAFGEPNAKFKQRDLWRVKTDGEYYPIKRKVNKFIFEELEKLPVVEYDALNKLVKYDWRKHSGNKSTSTGGSVIYFHPSLQWGKDYVLVGFSEHCRGYKPVPGMQEITVSEFNKLSGIK